MTRAPERELAEALAGLDRRGFLRWVGIAAGAGLLPTGCSAPESLAPPDALALRFLTPRTYAVLNAAAQAVVGPEGGALIDARAVDPGARAEAFLASAEPLAGPLRQALLALEFGVYPLLGKLRPFTALDSDGRAAILAELMTSRWSLKRLLFKGVKSVALLAFYGDPASHAGIGYPAAPGRPGPTIQDALRYGSEPPAAARLPGPRRRV